MFNLERRHIDFILEILNKHLTDTKYYIFGSRSKGTDKQYSDIDLALDYGNKIDTKIISKIQIELENSILPYEVDIVDLNSINENFKNLIKDDLKEFK